MLPENAAGVALEFGHEHSQRFTNGLNVLSNRNAIHGLQIVGFPNAGIALQGGARYNVIGGDRNVGAATLGQGNLVSGNVMFGVGLWGEGTSYNTIQGNYIGTDLGGTTAWGGQRDGIHSNGANYNLLMDNLIGGYSTGIYLCCQKDGYNQIIGNIVGTDALGVANIGNRSAGITIDRSGYNTVGPNNVSVNNGGPGIAVNGTDSVHNTITQNSIHDNSGGGIGLWEGGNAELAAPAIFAFDLQSGSMAGGTCPNCSVEIFSDSSDEGALYEGSATADSTGAFTFSKSGAFTGPVLTLTATDAYGNTSEFSKAKSGTGQSLILQDGNHLPKHPLHPRRSQELEDNRIGVDFESYQRYRNSEAVYAVGFKWMRLLSLTEYGGVDELGNWVECLPVTLNSIPPAVDEMITGYANNGTNIVLNLGAGAGLNLKVTFKSEADVDRLIDYVRLVVPHFKGRIRYYEIWNEPTGKIEVNDYVNLIKHVAPVIRKEDPGAKIVIGTFSAQHWETGYPGYGHYYRYSLDLDYLSNVLRSGVAQLVDVISWHPFYDNIPYDPYFQNYPEMVKKIKEVAASQGFTGEYMAEEVLWRTVTELNWPGGPPVSAYVAAKYYTRAIVLHRGLDVTISVNSFFLEPMLYSIHNLCDTLAGAKPISLAAEIQSEATNIMSYGFALPNGDRLFALWTDGVAVDNDPGVGATVTFPGLSAQKVTGIDVLNGFEQKLITKTENGSLVIRNLMVKDYPIIVRLVR